MSSPKRLGRAIAAARVALRMTGPELAARADVGASWIRQLETGRIEHPSRERLERVASVLGVDLGPYLEGDEERAAAAIEHHFSVPPWERLSRELRELREGQEEAIEQLAANQRTMMRALASLLLAVRDGTAAGVGEQVSEGVADFLRAAESEGLIRVEPETPPGVPATESPAADRN